jgi:hypothetical protein
MFESNKMKISDIVKCLMFIVLFLQVQTVIALECLERYSPFPGSPYPAFACQAVSYPDVKACIKFRTSHGLQMRGETESGIATLTSLLGTSVFDLVTCDSQNYCIQCDFTVVTKAPTTAAPTPPTSAPSLAPTKSPSTSAPSASPSSAPTPTNTSPAIRCFTEEAEIAVNATVPVFDLCYHNSTQVGFPAEGFPYHDPSTGPVVACARIRFETEVISGAFSLPEIQIFQVSLVRSKHK